MEIERLRSILNLLNLREVSRGCGVHENTLYRIARGSEARYSTILKIIGYLKGKGLING